MKKISYTISVTMEDGSTVAKTVTKDFDVPNPLDIDRHTQRGLLRDLDKLERAMISTRREAEQAFAQGYVDEGEPEKKRGPAR